MTKGYIRKIRSRIGSEKFICPAARIIIENDKGEFLFIERVDNGKLGIPAGGFEEHETIKECIIREVQEETGIVISEVQVIGISTNPALESVTYPNGDQIQYFTIEFYTNKFEGTLYADGTETKTASFNPATFINQLPKNERSTFDSLEIFRTQGKINVR